MEEVEDRSKERLDELNRERAIQLKLIKRLAQFRVESIDSQCSRIIPEHYLEKVTEYELGQGRLNVRPQPALGLVDFISEEADGESRLIVVTDDIDTFMDQLIPGDHTAISNRMYVYGMIGDRIIEYRLEDSLKKYNVSKDITEKPFL